MQQAVTPLQLELQRKLHQDLYQNEQVIWYSYPNADRRAKQSVILMLSFLGLGPRLWVRLFSLLLVAIAFLAVNSTYASDPAVEALPQIYWGVLLLLFILLFALGFWRAHSNRKRIECTIYAITNQRLIIITKDQDQFTPNAYQLAELGRIDLVERHDQWGDIILSAQQRMRSTGLARIMTTPRLIGIANVRAIASLLLSTQAQGALGLQ